MKAGWLCGHAADPWR